jgi:multicomponent Na+:H+ antiporter subunit G
MKDLVVAVLMVVGALLSFLAAVGILRMPDLFTRMQAATKSGTMGVGLIIAAVAVDAAELGHSASAILVIAFQLLTAPVAAHMIARAAYFTGVRLWEGTIQDELRENYDQRTHLLRGRLEALSNIESLDSDSAKAQESSGNAETSP